MFNTTSAVPVTDDTVKLVYDRVAVELKLSTGKNLRLTYDQMQELEALGNVQAHVAR